MVIRMGLFDKLKKSKWKDENPQVRMQGINELAQDVKHMKKNQEILRDILKNDPDSNVRILAIQKINSDAAIKDAALYDSDWKVRKAAVENLKIFLDNTIIYFPDNHYEVNKTLINFLENISKNDSNSEVREAANRLVNDPKYNKNALNELHKNEPKEINYTVVDVSRNTERTIVLNQNEKFEYVYHPKSVEDILDCCFGGDIITITYYNKTGPRQDNLIVDYNILDKHVANINKIPINGTDFDRIISYENIDSQNFARNAFGLSKEELYENTVLKKVLQHYLLTDKFFIVKKGDEIEVRSMELNNVIDTLKVERTPSLFLAKLNYEIKDIEFVCRKINQLPMSENMTIYRE